MPIILNGANGIITPSTTSSGDVIISDKIVHLDDTNTAIRFPAADTVTVETAGSERLRIDSSGNLGLGTSSPSYSSAGRGNLTLGGSSSAILGFQIGGAAKGYVFHDNTNLQLWNEVAGTILLGTNATERARIDSAGNLFLGTTSFSAFPTQTTGGMNVFQMGSTFSRAPQNTSGRYWFYGSEGAAGAAFVLYNHNNTGVFVAYGGTSWTANSDERTKTPIVPFENAVDKVCSLRAGTGRYLTDEEDVSRSFLIAQDVQAVLPEAVTIKEDEQGTLGLSYTDVIPLLVAAIKEQQATITALTARITALESQ
jgi:hypothetical protein